MKTIVTIIVQVLFAIGAFAYAKIDDDKSILVEWSSQLSDSSPGCNIFIPMQRQADITDLIKDKNLWTIGMTEDEGELTFCGIYGKFIIRQGSGYALLELYCYPPHFLITEVKGKKGDKYIVADGAKERCFSLPELFEAIKSRIPGLEDRKFRLPKAKP